MDQNKELRLAWDFVEHTGTSIFLTGKAGTGKTTFLRTLREHTSKRLVVVAPTGVAAVNAGGVTIHSFFQLPLSPYVPGAAIRDRYDFGKEKRRIIRTLDMLVIDEISMVRSDLLDAIDFVLRRYRDPSRPFGGVQLLMIGDLQQLTPVVTPQDEEILRGHYDTPYFFGSRALQQVNYVTIQLTHVYRQQDENFISILNHIRDGHPTADDLARLNARHHPTFFPKAEEGYIRLTTHNRMADSYNETELMKLSGQRYSFQAEVKGDFPEYNYPTDVSLELKVGAQVMFVKNDTSADHLYYNGRIGHVVELNAETVLVKCPGDSTAIKVERQQWENTKYALNPQTKTIEAQVQGTFTQYPLRLAWAITIHKSQGLTFDRAIIDSALSFAPGQVYVALSRCKSLEGLVLASPVDSRSIINDHRVADYIAHQQEEAEASVAALPQLKEEYFRYQLLDLFDFGRVAENAQLVHRTLVEFFRGMPALTAYYAKSLTTLKAKVMDVAYKWQTVIRSTETGTLHEAEFLSRVQRSATYFVTALEESLSGAIEKGKLAQSQNKKAMQLMDERYKEMWLSYLAKDRLLRKMEEEPFDVATYMTTKQETMLDAMDVVMPNGSRERKPRTRVKSSAPFGGEGEVAAVQTKPARPAKGATYDTTLQLFLQGKRPEEIARERGLSESTIYGHLGKFVWQGRITADKIIGASKVKAIRHAIAQLPEGATRAEVKAICRDDITWNDIDLMVYPHKRKPDEA
jgi:hypothetical protein